MRPAASTTVAVAREELVLDLRERDARIRATNQLQNVSQEAIEVTVAFPVPEYSGINTVKEAGAVVHLDGQPLAVETASAPLQLEPGETSVSANWLDPYTGDQYQPAVDRRQRQQKDRSQKRLRSFLAARQTSERTNGNEVTSVGLAT